MGDMQRKHPGSGRPRQGSQVEPERWRRVCEVFDAAVEMEPSAQRAYLERVARDDPLVAAEVAPLLRHDHEDDDLRRLIGETAASLHASTAAPGSTIGAYRLVSELGYGGMGTVWLAVRDDDAYRQQVAIKLLRGTTNEELQARFRTERQILASLEHPNIARLLDAGTTDDGTPYVVMEYIRGRPIDRYCAEEELTTEQRLELFCQVCLAVQHAHRNLIVHRDIKPANILVDAAGTPKLLDFGIAKLLDASLLPQPAPETRTGATVLTPRYASPEQIRGEPIATTADVYALGVLLYELLTERRPYRLKTHDPLELARAVCEQEPLPPSTVVTTPPDDQSEPPPDAARLSRRLAGDLDNIVLMALRKEPPQRYGSVEDIANDVRRHLGRLPVTARPSTLRYRIGKFISRYRWGLTAAAATAVVMVAATIVSMTQMRAAVRARAIAEQERAVAVTQAKRATYMAANARIDARDPLAALRLLSTVAEAQRGWEWRYLWSRMDRSIAVVRAPDAAAAGLARGVNEIVTLSRDGEVRWWDPADERLIARSRVAATAIHRAVFTLDGRRVAIAHGRNGQRVSIWELTADRAASLVFDEDLVFDEEIAATVTGLAVSYSGRDLVVATRDATWFWRDGAREPTVWRYGHPRSRIAVAGNGGLAGIVAEVGRGSYRVLDPGAPARADVLVSRDVIGVAISPTGSLVAAGETDAVIRVRDGATNRTVRRLRGHKGGPDVMAFSVDGRWLASATPGGAVRLWEVATEKQLAVFIGPAVVRELHFDVDGSRLLAFSDDGAAWVWSTSVDSLEPPSAEYHAQMIAYAADGSRAFALASDGELRTIDHASGQAYDLTTLAERDLAGLAISPDGRRIVTVREGEAVLRDAVTPTFGTAIPAESSGVLAVAYAPSGKRLATLGATGEAIVWLDSTLTPLVRMQGAATHRGGVVFAPDGSRLATTHDDGVRVWDASTGELLHVLRVGAAEAWSVAYRHDGVQLATGWSDGTIRLVDARTGNVQHVLAPHDAGVQALAYSPDGSRLASGGRDGTVWLSDVETASPVLELGGHQDAIVSLTFSPDGSTLSAGGGARLLVWDTVPRRARVRATARMQWEQERIRPHVATLFSRSPDPAAVARTLRADSTLSPAQRAAALRLTLDPPRPPSGVARDPFDGFAFESDAPDSYVRIGSDPGLRMRETFTLEAWVQPLRIPGAPRELGAVINKEGEYQISIFPDGEVAWNLAGPDGWTRWNYTRFRIPLGTWAHLALVRDGSTVRFHLNGRCVETTRFTEPPGDHDRSMDELRISGRQGTPQSFRGRIDEVRIWSIARSEAQTRDAMRRRLRGDELGLVAAWSFDEGSGRVARDLRGRYPGTLVGGRWSATSR